MAVLKRLFPGVAEEELTAVGFMNKLVTVGKFHQLDAVMRPVASPYFIMTIPQLGNVVIDV